MLDTLITFTIVAVVFVWFARYLYRICTVEKTSCGCGKGSCASYKSSSCERRDMEEASNK